MMVLVWCFRSWMLSCGGSIDCVWLPRSDVRSKLKPGEAAFKYVATRVRPTEAANHM